MLLKALLGLIYAGAVLALVAGALATVTRFTRRSWPSWLRWWLGLGCIAQLLNLILSGALLMVLGLWSPREFRIHFPWSLLVAALFFASLAALAACIYVERRVPPLLERWRWMDKPWKVALAIVALLVGVGAFRRLSAPPFEPDPAMNLETAAPGTAGVQARFFGVSTLLIGDGETSLLIDGFFTRPSWLQMLFGPLGPDRDVINRALERGGVKTLKAVLVAHSHHDHALDSAFVAHKTGAFLVGSTSTANIACGQQPDDRIDRVKGGDSRIYGAFHVTFFQTPHSPDPIAPGVICKPLRMPARLCDFQLGEAYTFLLTHPAGRILVVPGANYVTGLFKDIDADVVLLSVGGLGNQSTTFARRYWNQTVRATHAKLVVPIHWDDFGRPYDKRDPEHLQGSPPAFDDMEKTICRLRSFAATDHVRLGFMPPNKPVALLDLARKAGNDLAPNPCPPSR